MSKVRNQANQFGFDPYEELAPSRPWAADVDYEIEVPLDYWVRGALLEPSATQDRTRQLRLFRKLLLGDYRDWVRADALFAFHAFHVNTMAKVLMSSPPQIETAAFIKPRTIQMLLRATRKVIVDMIAYGTGLFHVTRGPYGAEVSSPSPLRWYPASSEADVLVNYRGGKTAELYRSSNTGEMEYRRVRVQAGYIGDLLEEPIVESGDPALWQLVQASGEGRVGAILNVPREPSTGDWGQSLFPYITDMTLMYNQRQSQINQIVQRDGNPLGLLTLDPRAEPPPPGDVTDDDQAALDIVAAQIWYDSWRKQHIARLGPGENFRYEGYRSNLADQFDNLQLLLSQLFLMTGIPDYLHGVNTAQGVPSGVALELMNLPATAVAGELIGNIEPVLAKVLLVCGIYEGASLADLTAMREQTVIEWSNALTLVRQPQTMIVDSDGRIADVGATQRDRDESDPSDGSGPDDRTEG